MKKENLDLTKYDKFDKTLSFSRASKIIIVFAIPIFLILFIVTNFLCDYKEISIISIIIFLLIIGVGISLYEFIRGLTWSMYTENQFNDIKFTFDLKTFSPCTYCNNILPIKAYRFGLILPFIIIGVFPYVLSLILNSYTLSVPCIFLFISSIGDLIILFKLKNEPLLTLVEDEENLLGCTIYKEISTKNTPT